MKRYFAFLLAALMLVSACMLSACHTDPQPSQDTSTESAEPLTAKEQYAKALEEIFAPVNALYASIGAPSTFKSPENAQVSLGLTIDRLIASGESVLGDDPVAVRFTVQQYEAITQLAFGLEAFQEKLTGYFLSDGGDMFLMLDGLLDKPAKLPQDEEEEDIDMTQYAELQQAIKEIIEELGNNEELFSVTDAEGGKLYTLTVDNARIKAYVEKLQAALPQTATLNDDDDDFDLSPDLAGMLEDLKNYSFKMELQKADNAASELRAVLTDEAEKKTAFECLLTVTNSENKTELKLTMRDDEKELMSEEASYTVKDGKLEASIVGKANGKRVVELTSVSQKDGDGIKSDATLTLSVDMGGAVLSVPMTMSGVTKYGEQSVESTMQLAVTIPSVLELAITMDVAVAPAEKPEVPTDFVNADDLDGDELEEKFAEKYPSLYEAFTSAGGDYDNGDYRYYADLNGLISFTFNTGNILAIETQVDLTEVTVSGAPCLKCSFGSKELITLRMEQTEDGALLLNGMPFYLVEEGVLFCETDDFYIGLEELADDLYYVVCYVPYGYDEQAGKLTLYFNEETQLVLDATFEEGYLTVGSQTLYDLTDVDFYDEYAA